MVKHIALSIGERKFELWREYYWEEQPRIMIMNCKIEMYHIYICKRHSWKLKFGETRGAAPETRAVWKANLAFGL